MFSIMMGKLAADKLNVIPLSDNTAQHRISDMAWLVYVYGYPVEFLREGSRFGIE